ncbi:hypothetical protein Q7F20_18505, partial [Curtobacterium sp. A7_M15]|nr:hypothetical protein [Curtobacterium sp. A7_M15]
MAGIVTRTGVASDLAAGAAGSWKPSAALPAAADDREGAADDPAAPGAALEEPAVGSAGRS